jgi:DnaJ-domain-containing protein 1
VSIGRRLIDLARAELNSLLDRASSSHGEEAPDADEDLYRRYGLDELTDSELEAELDRRRQARDAAARAASARSEEGARAARARAEENARRAAQGAARPRPATGPDEVRRAYAALEVSFGADFVTVRKSYHRLMRKYHPDRHGQSPEKQKAANEVAQRLSAAYRTLSSHLGK